METMPTDGQVHAGALPNEPAHVACAAVAMQTIQPSLSSADTRPWPRRIVAGERRRPRGHLGQVLARAGCGEAPPAGPPPRLHRLPGRPDGICLRASGRSFPYTSAHVGCLPRLSSLASVSEARACSR